MYGISYAKVFFMEGVILNIEELPLFSLLSFDLQVHLNTAVWWTDSPSYNFCIEREKPRLFYHSCHNPLDLFYYEYSYLPLSHTSFSL